MYEPPAFRNDDVVLQHGLIRAHPLGLLISNDASGITANAVPFELVESTGGQGLLRCHLAKANGQWKNLDGQPVLVVFQGGDAYVSPQWYAAKREHGKVVPTWNYAMVQVRGQARVIADPDWLQAQVSRLTDAHEGAQVTGTPWRVSDAPAGYLESQLKGIVGVEIEIAAMTGKFKASQNRSAEDRAGVVDGLLARGRGDDAKMAALTKLKASG